MLAAISCDDDKKTKSASLISKLTGEWTRGEGGYCKINSAKTAATIKKLKIEKDFSYQEINTAYNDTKCTNEQITVTQSGKINILGPSESIDQAIIITRSVTKFEAVWRTDNAVKAANKGEGYCGIKDWKKDESREITDATCKTSSDKDISYVYQAREDGKQNQDRNMFVLGEKNKTLSFGSESERINSEDADDKCSSLKESTPDTACFPTTIEEGINEIYHLVEDEAEKKEVNEKEGE
jgi:hypothetical protein